MYSIMGCSVTLLRSRALMSAWAAHSESKKSMSALDSKTVRAVTVMPWLRGSSWLGSADANSMYGFPSCFGGEGGQQGGRRNVCVCVRG